MSLLPTPQYADRIEKTTQIAFGGLRHHVNCADGELYDMENLTCAEYPVLSTREYQTALDVLHGAGGDLLRLYAADGAFLCLDADGDIWYAPMRDAPIAHIEPPLQEVRFVRFGDRVVILPQKLILNLKYPILGIAQATPGEKEEDIIARLEKRYPDAKENDAYAVGGQEPPYTVYAFVDGKWQSNGPLAAPMEARVTVVSTRDNPDVTFLDGTIFDEPAKGNTIAISGQAFDLRDYFKAGDGVRISGLTVVPENNKIAIIRELNDHLLRFSDNCFKMQKDAQGTVQTEFSEIGEIMIERFVPEMDFLFEHGNRLWGAKGKEIYASKLGDPMNWNVFDGLSGDSWYLQTQTPGEFTGGYGYDYPRFFREDSMTTVYGSDPAQFQTQTVQMPGVAKGAQESIAQAGRLLFWASDRGLVIYDGDAAYLQDQAFGTWKVRQGLAAGTPGTYRIAAWLDEQRYALCCYDTERRLWTLESCPEALSVCSMDAEAYLLANMDPAPTVIRLDGPGEDGEKEWTLHSFAEFGDFTDASPNRKAVTKLQLRLELEEGAELSVKIRYDSRGDWLTVQTLHGGAKRSVYLAVLPRRCDHYRIRLEGKGQWKLYSMAKERYIGSELH